MDGALVERDCFPGFPCLDKREAKIGQGWRVTRICGDNILKQWYCLLLLSAGLEGESQLILGFEVGWSEIESVLQNRDRFLILFVGDQRLGKLNLGESALWRKLRRLSSTPAKPPMFAAAS